MFRLKDWEYFPSYEVFGVALGVIRVCLDWLWVVSTSSLGRLSDFGYRNRVMLNAYE